jgi:ribosomal protein S8
MFDQRGIAKWPELLVSSTVHSSTQGHPAASTEFTNASVLYSIPPWSHSLSLIILIVPMFAILSSFLKSTNFLFFFEKHNYISLNQQRTNKTITVLLVLWNHSKINAFNHSQEVYKEHRIKKKKKRVWSHPDPSPESHRPLSLCIVLTKNSSFQVFQVSTKQH